MTQPRRHYEDNLMISTRLQTAQLRYHHYHPLKIRFNRKNENKFTKDF